MSVAEAPPPTMRDEVRTNFEPQGCYGDSLDVVEGHYYDDPAPAPEIKRELERLGSDVSAALRDRQPLFLRCPLEGLAGRCPFGAMINNKSGLIEVDRNGKCMKKIPAPDDPFGVTASS